MLALTGGTDVMEEATDDLGGIGGHYVCSIVLLELYPQHIPPPGLISDLRTSSPPKPASFHEMSRQSLPQFRYVAITNGKSLRPARQVHLVGASGIEPSGFGHVNDVAPVNAHKGLGELLR